VTRVAVLGAGSWGTTLANLLACKGDSIRLWAYEPEVVDAINRDRANPVFLPGVNLSPRIRAFGDPGEAVAGAEVILSVPPSHAVRGVIAGVRDSIPRDALVVSATKGIEGDSLALMSQVFAELMPGARFVALSGPSFAAEVAAGQPTAVVAAAKDEADARVAQAVFATPAFRVYRNLDVIGVELAGALKNVIAVAAGIAEGLGLGHNPLTFAGLAGMGDLVLTATGSLSRNRTLGVALAEGQSFEQYRAAHRTVAEGANTSRAGAALGKRLGIELPITEQVCDVLFRGKPPREAIAELMGRELKSEQWR
jgi:glycerol-3-phosphate dehydrogenase (NAD(P)+)